MTQTAKSESLVAPAWRFLASIRLTVALLLLLAATSILGTLIPQGGAPSEYIGRYGETIFRLLYAFDLYDMYHSWWFRGLILLLTGNIVVCTLKRFPSVWKIVFSGKTAPTSVKPGKVEPVAFEDARDPEALQSEYEAYIRKRFRRVETESMENGFRIVAERGRWTRLGVSGVHLSIVILLAGALVGSLFGFDGYVNIAEGESIDRVRLRNDNTVMPLGFEVRCEDFNVSFYDSGAPKEYRSRLQILENGKIVVEKDIIVNDPLRYKGVNFFQSSYGSLPARELTLNLTNRDSGEAVRVNAALGRRVEIPGTDLRFYFRQIENRYRLRGMDVGETVLGVLETPTGETTEVILPVRFPSYDKMRKGEWIVSVADHEHRYYTGLQTTRDPGVPLVYAGFILLIAGCWVAFFMAHQKVAVEVTRSARGCAVRVYGSSNRHPVGFETFLKKIAAGLARQKGGAHD